MCLLRGPNMIPTIVSAPCVCFIQRCSPFVCTWDSKTRTTEVLHGSLMAFLHLMPKQIGDLHCSFVFHFQPCESGIVRCAVACPLNIQFLVPDLRASSGVSHAEGAEANDIFHALHALKAMASMEKFPKCCTGTDRL